MESIAEFVVLVVALRGFLSLDFMYTCFVCMVVAGRGEFCLEQEAARSRPLEK